MNTQITKKQHYVWRRYLNAWKNAKEDKEIWTGFLQSKEVKKVALMSVAQSSYFYKLEKLTDEELDTLRQFTNRFSTKVQDVANKLLSGYMMFTQLKSGKSSEKMKMDESHETAIKIIETTSFEAIQSRIEQMGDELLRCMTIKDVEAIVKDNEFEILYYLMVQYLRTRTMKGRVVKSLVEATLFQEIGKKCWPFFNLTVAMELVQGIVLKNDSRFVFVNNKSSKPFITGDQPIINALGDIKNENGEVKDWELYYPLSPQTALVLEFTPGDKFSEKDVDEKYVKEKNEMIMKESLIHIFANDENILRSILA